MCLRIWSRETCSAAPSRVSLLISILRLNLVLTYGIPPEFRGGVRLRNRHTPSGQSRISGHAFEYRWRSLSRVRRHRTSKPQGSSERVLRWQVTMDQLKYTIYSPHQYRRVARFASEVTMIATCVLLHIPEKKQHARAGVMLVASTPP